MRRGFSALACGLVAVSLAACNGDETADGDPEAFCDAAADAQEYEKLFDGMDPNDVEEATATFEEALAAERQLRDDAPGAIRADVDILVRFFEDLLAGLETEDPNSPERPSVYEELRPRFDQVEAASTRIERYVDANC